MIKKIFFILFSISVVISASNDVPEKRALQKQALISWENLQKSDENTVNFKKVNDSVYEFSTKYFEYNGLLIFKNVFIDEQNFDTLYPYTATIDFILPDYKNEESIGMRSGFARWRNLNFLYYDKGEENWITSEQYREQMQKRSEEEIESYNELLPRFINFLPTIVIIVMCVSLIAYLHSISQGIKLEHLYLRQIIKLLSDKNSEQE